MPTPEEAYQAIESRMQTIGDGYCQSFAGATTVESLESARSSMFTEESDLTQVLRTMKELPGGWEPQLNDLVSAFRTRTDNAYQERLAQVQ